MADSLSHEEIDVVEAEPGDEEAEVEEIEEPAEAEAGADEGADEADEGEPQPGALEPEEPDVYTPSEVEVERLRAESAAREAEHWRKTHDKLSGVHGETVRKLRGRLGEAMQRISELNDGEGSSGYEAPRSTAPKVARDPRIDRLVEDADERRMQAAQRVFQDTVDDFDRRAGHGKPLPQDIKEAIRDYLVENRGTIEDVITAGDKETTAVVTQRLLSEGLLRGIAARQERNDERKGRETEKLRDTKRLATPSGAAPRRGQPGKPKRPEDMTLDELEAFYRRQGRRGF